MPRRRVPPPPEEHRLAPGEAAAAMAGLEGLMKERATHWHKLGGRVGAWDDYFAAARGGAWDATTRFDKRRGAKFITFARKWMDKWCQRQMRHDYQAGAVEVGDVRRPASFAGFGREHAGICPDDRAGQHGEWVIDHRPAAPADGDAVWAAVDKALAGVERRVVLLRFRDGLSLNEAARRLGRDSRGVATVLAAALRRLRRAVPELEDLLRDNSP